MVTDNLSMQFRLASMRQKEKYVPQGSKESTQYSQCITSYRGASAEMEMIHRNSHGSAGETFNVFKGDKD